MNKYMKNIFAFPGVGVKFCGKEKDFFLRNKKFVIPYIETASMKLGKDLMDVFNRDEQVFLNSQEERFFTAAFSCAVASFFSSCGVEADGAACYSFGIYPALYSTEVLSFDEILDVMSLAEKHMSIATDLIDEPCGMAVIVGLIKEDAEELIRRVNKESLLKVNENNDTCIIVSGLKKDLENYIKVALDEDAITAELLDVNIPYHHSGLLGSIKEDLKKELGLLNWKDAKFPIISSVDRSVLIKAEDILNFAVDNTCTPISWYHVVEKAAKSGAERIFECGHGISLTQNGRFSGLDIDYVNIKNYKRKLSL